MNIEFIPTSDFAEKILPRPLPATKFIPDWYSKMNLFTRKDKNYGISNENIRATNTTVKACTPFLDAMSTGYMWYLPLDIEVKKRANLKDYDFKWRSDEPAITEHSKDQHPTLPSLFNGEDFVMKFHFDFVIKTPPGYSTFFTHPINRHDLPFRTFSGVVDTDRYNLPIQFPFQIYEFDTPNIIINKGTPVCQFFSFKRDSWQSSFKKFDPEKQYKNLFNFLSIIKRSYKTQFWSPKEYR